MVRWMEFRGNLKVDGNAEKVCSFSVSRFFCQNHVFISYNLLQDQAKTAIYVIRNLVFILFSYKQFTLVVVEVRGNIFVINISSYSGIRVV
jgi:hypothetical protein